ncbi:MAG: tyrosine-type recombinase/integrase [Magnetospirillum sp. WYHS-4]
MPTIKLSKRAIDDLEPGERDAFFWDEDLAGFGVKVTPKGRKVFLVQYRPGGRGTPTRKVFLGPHGPVTLHNARNEARRILGLRAEGRDVALERQTAKVRAISDRFGDIAADFLEKHAAQNRTVEETKRILQQDVLPKWGKRSIHGIGKRDVIDLLDQVVSRGSPIMANRLLAALRKLFNWAMSRGIITVSPCEGISAPIREVARDRVLTDDELVAIINAATTIGGAFSGIMHTLIFTAQRRDEVADMRWDELNLDTSVWTIPGSRTKNGKPHFVHLSAQARALLDAAPKIGDYVFTTNGKTPFSGFSKSKARLDELSGVSNWRIHDIRRTVTSGLAKLGIAPHVADKILNHQSGTISGVAAVYQRHDFLSERKAAIDAWGRHVQALVDGIVSDNVVRLGALK